MIDKNGILAATRHALVAHYYANVCHFLKAKLRTENAIASAMGVVTPAGLMLFVCGDPEREAVAAVERVMKVASIAQVLRMDGPRIHILVQGAGGLARIKDPLASLARCRVCGCTDSEACPSGCYWVEPDLCSRCARGDGENHDVAVD